MIFNNIIYNIVYDYLITNTLKKINDSYHTIIPTLYYYSSPLIEANFPACTSIGSSAFYRCSNLTSISFPSCNYIGSYAFRGCISLTLVSFPNCTFIENYAFASCSTLTSINFPNCTYVGNNAFDDCWNLLSVYLLGSSIPQLSDINAFQSTPISNYTTSTGGQYGSIFVPASLYNSYITATNWSVYSSRIVSV